MEPIIEKVMDMGIGQFMDKSRQGFSKSDAAYLKYGWKEEELERKFMNLDLSNHQRLIINDYISCMKTADNREADISYIAGVKDAIKMFVRLGLLKEEN